MSAASFRVLLVDDAADVRALTRKALERTGRFDIVAEAADGQQAVDIAQVQQPNLVLLDLSMPVMDGMDALPLLRDAVPAAVIVVLSGLEAERMAPQARAKGASAFMPKALGPVRVAEQLLAFMDKASSLTSSGVSKEATLRLDADPISARRARRFVEETLTGWDCAHLADIVLLLTSELVTNAVLHAGSQADLTLRTDGTTLRIAVADQSPVSPVVRPPNTQSTTGRGMLLLDAMASSWSIVPTDAGKVVWFEVDASVEVEPTTP